ncbi:MAG: hypothetical protein AAF581_08965 [Planctomycetota bacterium]
MSRVQSKVAFAVAFVVGLSVGAGCSNDASTSGGGGAGPLIPQIDVGTVDIFWNSDKGSVPIGLAVRPKKLSTLEAWAIRADRALPLAESFQAIRHSDKPVANLKTHAEFHYRRVVSSGHGNLGIIDLQYPSGTPDEHVVTFELRHLEKRDAMPGDVFGYLVLRRLGADKYYEMWCVKSNVGFPLKINFNADVVNKFTDTAKWGNDLIEAIRAELKEKGAPAGVVMFDRPTLSPIVNP